MAWSITPKIGGPYICAEPCQHTDCRQLRELIATVCPVCEKPLGEDEQWTNYEDKPTHFWCAVEAAKA